MAKKAEVIPPDAYPQMVSKAQAVLMARTLRSHVTAVTATRVIEDSGEILRGAVRAYVEELEEAGMDFELVSEKAHEIRGFAETPRLARSASSDRRKFSAPRSLNEAVNWRF